MAWWVTDLLTMDVYFFSYYMFRVLFVHLLPCISLVVLNVLLFKALRQAQDKRDKLLKENRKSECRKLRDSNCTTLMLIVVVTVSAWRVLGECLTSAWRVFEEWPGRIETRPRPPPATLFKFSHPL